ncbi:sulfatase-like hydrolase/transferase [Nocardioidaceae bacterium SCSIO 66511]|nr:sulfatase-like hydrolase/transferase [Nocardioidaceae bacterium SCSIO 66511]
MAISRRRLLAGAGSSAVATLGQMSGSAPAAASSAPTRPPKPPKYFPPREPNVPPLYPRANKPNIVLILADDMGFSDAGCYGGDIDTPNIDSLATRGMLFTNATNEARCAPSRAALLTGLHPTQSGIGNMPGTVSTMREYQQYLRKDVLTVGEIVSRRGYATAHIGKWHVGNTHQSAPNDRGFDYSLVAPGGRSYWDDRWRVNGEPTTIAGYTTDIVTQRSVDYLASREGKQAPFFLNVAYKAPHWPLQHPDDATVAKYRDRFSTGWRASERRRVRKQREIGLFPGRVKLSTRRHLDPWKDVGDQAWETERMAVYAAQIETMDTGIGRILDELRRQGIDNDTVVIFASDNGGTREGVPIRTTPEGDQYGNVEGVMPGGPTVFQSYGPNWGTVSNTPFAEHKVWLGEGGISNPLIISWPDRFKRPRKFHGSINLFDITPTIASLAGADLRKPRFRRRNGVRVQYPSGMSLVTIFDGKAGRKFRDRVLCWEHVGHRAVRTKRWKLVRDRNDRRWRLYDLKNDRSERVDLAKQRPDVRRELLTAWKQWANWVNVGEYSRRNGKDHYVPHHW